MSRSLLRLGSAALTLLLVMPSPAAQRRKKRVQGPQSAAGQRLARRYASEMAKLAEQIRAALPKIARAKRQSFESAVRAEHEAKARVEAARKSMGKIGSARGLVGHAKGKWIGGADRGIARAKKQLAKAKTAAARAAARKELAKWQQNRKDGLKALAERQAALDKALREQPRLERALASAKRALSKAEARIQRALTALKLDACLAKSDLDAKLATFVVLHEADPARLARFAEAGAAQLRVLEDAMKDSDLLLQMLVAGGASYGNYARCFEIYRAIQQASPKAAKGTLQRLRSTRASPAILRASSPVRPCSQESAAWRVSPSSGRATPIS